MAGAVTGFDPAPARTSLFETETPDARPARGMARHESPRSGSEVWLTPPHILDALGVFDMDPCACMAPRPYPTARRHLTREDNGLAHPWSGRVWLNPPYGPPSVIAPWMDRMVAHGCGTALVFARCETEMFHRCIWDAAHAILFFRGRLHFHYPDGVRSGNNAGAPSCLVAYGSADLDRLARSGLPGKMVTLRKSGL